MDFDQITISRKHVLLSLGLWNTIGRFFIWSKSMEKIFAEVYLGSIGMVPEMVSKFIDRCDVSTSVIFLG